MLTPPMMKWLLRTAPGYAGILELFRKPTSGSITRISLTPADPLSAGKKKKSTELVDGPHASSKENG